VEHVIYLDAVNRSPVFPSVSSRVSYNGSLDWCKVYCSKF